ncbi:MAG: hypothetical protein NW200_14755 [Hyphomonadaceae bacterium]|nr:hypothetical protein [Hyphomonadaceae bacterium]
MTWRDLPLPSSIHGIVTVLIDAVSGAVRGFARRLREGGGDGEDAPTLSLVRRLERIVRYTAVILASYLTPVTPRMRARAASAAPAPPATARMRSFRLTRPWRAVIIEDAPEDAAAPRLSNALMPARAPGPEALAARIAVLRRAVANPLPLARRLSRLAEAGVIVVLGWAPPRRPPPRRLRAFWDELCMAWDQARFDMARLRARACDTS